MKTVTDMKTALAEVNDQMTALLEQQTAMKTDLAIVVASRQDTLIDTVTTAMSTLSGQLATAKANNDAMQAELAAALATVAPQTS